MLPNLSRLSISNNLFEKLVEEGVAKNKECKTAEKCDVDGFLMYKPIEGSSGESEVLSGTDVTLESGITFTSLPSELESVEDKFEHFRKKHKDWVKTVFYRLCKRGGDLGSIRWRAYGLELMSFTDWYFLDEEQRGQIFVSLVNNEGCLLYTSPSPRDS